jgi:hypothetical protein
MYRIVFVLLVTVFSAPAAARVIEIATVAASTKNAELKAGLKQYDELEFEAALKSLGAALAAPDLTRDEVATAALYSGMIAHSLNDKAAAKAAFQKALGAVPDVDLPEDAPPKTQLAFAEAKKTFKAPAAAPAPVVAPPPPVLIPPPPPPKLSVPDSAVQIPTDSPTDPLPESKPLHKQWWVWAGAGGVVVGVTVVIVLLSGGKSPGTGCGTNDRGCIDVTTPSAVWRFQ